MRLNKDVLGCLFQAFDGPTVQLYSSVMEVFHFVSGVFQVGLIPLSRRLSGGFEIPMGGWVILS